MDTSGQTISITITTPSGDRYETNVPSNTLVDQLIQAILSQWQPPVTKSPGSQRFSLHPADATNLTLDRSSTLLDAGLHAAANLELIPETLEPGAPVGLMIQDDRGDVYRTAVLVNMPVGRLAEAFLKDKPGTGEVIVEWAGNVVPTTNAKRLKLDASLYDQGVSDDSLLRIYRVPTTSRSE